MITTEQLHIGYSKSILTVEDLNLSSGLYILAGKNGSGKSTLLRTLSGQLSPVRGSVEIEGTDLTNINKADLPKKIAFVGSHFPIVDFLKVEDFIALGRSPFTNFFGRKTDNDNSIIKRSIETLKIEHLAGRFTSELSDGEKQLVSIAKALVQETKIIALDEPTAFLDYSNKKLVLDQLIEISESMNKCIIMSSHDIDLCLEAKRPFLVVHDKENVVKTVDADISKSELLALAFN